MLFFAGAYVQRIRTQGTIPESVGEGGLQSGQMGPEGGEERELRDSRLRRQTMYREVSICIRSDNEVLLNQAA